MHVIIADISNDTLIIRPVHETVVVVALLMLLAVIVVVASDRISDIGKLQLIAQFLIILQSVQE